MEPPEKEHVLTLSQSLQEHYDLVPFELRHWYEDIMPHAERHPVTTSNKHKDKRPTMRTPRRKEPRSSVILPNHRVITHLHIFVRKTISFVHVGCTGFSIAHSPSHSTLLMTFSMETLAQMPYLRISLFSLNWLVSPE